MRTRPRYPALGEIGFRLSHPFFRACAVWRGLYPGDSPYARERIAAAERKLSRGETIHVLGIGAGGHNAGVGLVSASREQGIRSQANHEEERFRGIKHYKRFPARSVEALRSCLARLDLKFADLDSVVTTWDYPRLLAESVRCVCEEAPSAVRLYHPKASPAINLPDGWAAYAAPHRLAREMGIPGPQPIIALRHHANHAWFSYGVSPFAGSPEPVMVAVLDGMGDDGSISLYVAREGHLERVYSNRSLFDSLGMMYLFLSSSLGGWPPLSSEGRLMGAAAWGDQDRATNRFYPPLRELFAFEEDGEIRLNRDLANWHRAASLKPYTRRLEEILGVPIPLYRMWQPDAVLTLEDIADNPATQERAERAAAIQLVFEDALVHVVENFIRKSGSTRLILTGGAALNCLANLALLERFDAAWMQRHLGEGSGPLQLWVPPIPGDAGVPIGAAYHFCGLAGARPGPPGDSLEHAFYCGEAADSAAIAAALAATPEIGHTSIGNVRDENSRQAVADFMARVVAQDGVIGIFQGVAETGPRALGHRSILANPRNPETLAILNRRVKFREPYRPLAPMVTMEAAQRFFHLPVGAAAADFNALNYMVLAVRARPEARDVIPAVIHRDGTSRVQIVRPHIDPLIHTYLTALGREIGAEVSVNTSLNVNSPIVQTPAQALDAVKRSRGIDALFLVSAEGDVTAAWHQSEVPPKDGGRRFRQWLEESRAACVCSP